MIIYKISQDDRFGAGNTVFETGIPLLNDTDYYLYREVRNDYDHCSNGKKVSEDFVKVVDQKWFDDHPAYYGCRVYDDVHSTSNGFTEYYNDVLNLH